MKPYTFNLRPLPPPDKNLVQQCLHLVGNYAPAPGPAPILVPMP